MKKKASVWQVGWENEAKTIEVEDDDCPACEHIGPLPNGMDPVVMAYRFEDQASASFRYIEGVLGLGNLCAEATAEQIAEAETTAAAIRSGAVKEAAPPTAEERDAMAKVTVAVKEHGSAIIGSLLSAYGETPAMRSIGHAMVADWCASAGQVLGRAASKKSDKKK